MIKKKKQKPLFSIPLGKKKIKITKPRLEWSVLILLVSLVAAGLLSGAFSFGYAYVKCGGLPLEMNGSYYRIPGDDGYGVRASSDYSNCSYAQPPGVQRDPSTKMGARLAEEREASTGFLHTAVGYDVYVPEDYTITALSKSRLGDDIVTSYYVTTNSHVKFQVRELKKDNDFSYTNLCSRPAGKYWSGQVIGRDSQGREVCRTHSRYVTKYVVGINIGGTGIMLEAPIDGSSSEELLNKEAIAVFSSMKLHSE